MAGMFDDELSSDDLLEESSELLTLAEVKKARSNVRAKTWWASEASAQPRGKNARKSRTLYASVPSKASQPLLQPRSVVEASVPSLKVKSRSTIDTNPVLLASACRDETPMGTSASRHQGRYESAGRDQIQTASLHRLSNKSFVDDEVPMGHRMSLSEVQNMITKRSQSSSSRTRSIVKSLEMEDTRARSSRRYSSHSFLSFPQDNDLVVGRSATGGMFSHEPQSKAECYQWPSLDMEDTPTTTRSAPFQAESACSSDLEDDFAQVMNTQADGGKARLPSQPWSSEGKRSVKMSIESMGDEPTFPFCLSPMQRQASMSSLASLTPLTDPKDSLEKAVSPKTITGKSKQRFRTWSCGQLKRVVNWQDETPKATVEDAFYFFCAPGRKTLDSSRFTRLCLVSNVAFGAFTSSDTRRWWLTIVGAQEIMTYEQFKSAINLIASELKVPVEEIENKVIGAT